MKMVRVKFKKGLREPIKESQPLYSFTCPFEKVEEGSMVLVEVRKNRKFDFRVAKVYEVYDLKINRKTPHEPVVAVMPFKDFDAHCEKIYKFKLNVNGQASVPRKKYRNHLKYKEQQLKRENESKEKAKLSKA